MSDTTAKAPRSPALLLVAVLVAAAASAATWWFTRPRGTPPAAPSLAFANAAPGTGWVGSEACAACHAEETQGHAASAHANSFGRVTPTGLPHPAAVDHEPSAILYLIDEDEGGVRVRTSLHMEDGPDESLGEHRLSYWIGSGAVARAFAAETDGYQMLAPLQLAAGAEGWRIDPACDGTLQPDFARALEPRCVHCHAGRAEQTDGAVHRYAIHEAAIGCERCHGPGQLHVERWRGKPRPSPGGAATDLTIANPARMPRDRAVAICAQCHMDPVLTVRHSGVGPWEWQAAQPWDAGQITYRDRGRPDAVPQPGPFDQLASSRCYQSSPDLGCSTCHEAHGGRAERTRARTNAACAQCHGTCGRPEPAAKAPGEDCAGCHMPAASQRKPHAVFHDHFIRAPHPPGQDPILRRRAPQEIELVPFLGDPAHLSEAERDRSVGLAAMRRLPWLRLPTHAKAMRQEVLGNLERARDQGLRDARLQQAWAMALLAGEHAEAARARAEKAHALAAKDAKYAPEHRADLLDVLLYMRGQEPGPSEAKLGYLRELTALRLRAEDWSALGAQWVASSNAEAGLEAALKARAVWPTNPGTQADAWTLLVAAGRKDEAAAAQRLYLRLTRQQSWVRVGKPR